MVDVWGSVRRSVEADSATALCSLRAVSRLLQTSAAALFARSASVPAPTSTPAAPAPTTALGAAAVIAAAGCVLGVRLKGQCPNGQRRRQ